MAGIATVFRHRPELDGQTVIQASTPEERPNPEKYESFASPECPPILPRIGFGAAAVSPTARVRYFFIKYEAPQQWHESYGFKSRGANIATTQVGDLHCEACGWGGVYPIKGEKGTMKCPWCGESGVVIDPIKIPSERFDGMIAELKQPLADAAVAALSTPTKPFRFPQIIIGGPDIQESLAVEERIRQAAPEGVKLRPLEELQKLGDLHALDMERIFLAIVPGITSGFVQDCEVKEGKSWQAGLCRYWLKVPLPDPPKAWRFGTCRF